MRGRPFACSACFRSSKWAGKCDFCTDFGTPIERAEKEVRRDFVALAAESVILVLLICLSSIRWHSDKLECFAVMSLIVINVGVTWKAVLSYRASVQVRNQAIARSIQES